MIAMKRVFPVLLPLALIAIAGATWWRMSIDDALPRGRSRSDVTKVPAPTFARFDQHRHLVKLERYFSRQSIVLVFFKPGTGIADNVWLNSLRENYEAIEDRGVVVVAVTTLTPAALNDQTVKQGNDYPFPLVSDIELGNPLPAAHALYGLYDPDTQSTEEGMFFIDREGTVSATMDAPVPIEQPEQFILDLIDGKPLPE